MKQRIFVWLVFLSIIFSFFMVKNRRPAPLTVHVISVGYGNAILVEFPGNDVLMIDAGPKESGPFLVRYLKARKIKLIHTFILTHPHADHFGGLDAIADVFPIETFYINGDIRNAHAGYAEVIEKLRNKGIGGETLQRGDDWCLAQNACVRVLHPEELVPGTGNESALVLSLSFGETSFLFTSDIQPSQQEDIMKFFPEIASADVVQIPAHGGKLADDFVRICENKVLLLSVGENSYGKPRAEELQKLKGRLFRTDRQGTIILRSDGRKIKVRTRHGTK